MYIVQTNWHKLASHLFGLRVSAVIFELLSERPEQEKVAALS